MIQYKPTPGDWIQSAAKQAHYIACTHNEPVLLVFNDYKAEVYPWNTVEEIICSFPPNLKRWERIKP
jgi:hypothetical protein